MELTEEQLKKMTPEQLAELQKANCLFCHISNGKVQSKVIHDDETCMAVLDINPANPGHLLLFPKEHFSILPQMPDEVLAKMTTAAKMLSAQTLRALKTQGTNIFVTNGVAAGQKAPHVIFHIIPRDAKDGLTCFTLKRGSPPEDADALSQRMRARLNQALGIKEKTPIQIDAKDDDKDDEEPSEEPEEKDGKESSGSLDVDNIAKVLGLE